MNTDGQRVVDLSDIDSQHISVDYQDGDLAILTDIRQIPEFSSMKMGMNVILFCLKGKLQFEVNGLADHGTGSANCQSCRAMCQWAT